MRDRPGDPEKPVRRLAGRITGSTGGSGIRPGDARPGTAVLVGAILLLSVASPVLAVDSQVAITGVTISPASVEPGEPFIATGTIRNAGSSDTAARITQVGLRGAGVLETHDDIGTLGSGESVDVPISAELTRPGQHELTFFVHGRDVGGDRFYYSYPVYVTVEEPASDVRLSVSSPEPIVGEDTPVNVTIANGGGAPISSLVLTLEGEAISVNDPRRVSSQLDTGAERVTTFDVTYLEPGPQTVTATLAFRTGEGYRRTVNESVTVDVDPLRIDADIAATIRQNGSERSVRTTVENFGNVDIEDLVIRFEHDGTLVERVQGPDVPPGESRAVDVDSEGFPAGSIDVEATYEAAGRTDSVATTLEYSPAVESRIELTGIDVTRSPGGVTISGDAANVGEADASAVLLRVVAGDGVTPVNPHREYFVGAIDSSEFATFELTAAVEPGVAAVRVEVLYTVDGERLSATLAVDVGDAAADPDGRRTGPSSSGFLLGAIGVMVLAAAIGGGLWWRRTR